jgi:hypothetical protein
MLATGQPLGDPNAHLKKSTSSSGSLLLDAVDFPVTSD